MPHSDTNARLLARLDHIRAWIHDHPDTDVMAVGVGSWDSGALQVGYPDLLQHGAPTRVGRWSVQHDGGWMRLLYVDLDGLSLYAGQYATEEEMTASDVDALRGGL